MKRKVITLCLLVALVSIAGMGTYAYFTAYGQATGVITTGALSFQIHEKTDTGEDFPAAGVIVMPGDVIGKTVTVENTGNQPMFLRVLVDRQVNDPTLSAEGCITLDLNTRDWTYRDGYYYYNYILEPGQTTQPLFTKVFVDGKNVTNAYIGKEFAVTIRAFAVQSAHNGTSALAALGWPEP